MTAIELLTLLNQQGITLSVDSGDLRISAPKGSITEELRAGLVQHKAELIELLTNAAADAQPDLVSIPRDADLPLSFAQQRLWFLDQLDPNTSLYNIPTALHLTGPLNKDALQSALNSLATRHELLRASFATKNRLPTVRRDRDRPPGRRPNLCC